MDYAKQLRARLDALRLEQLEAEAAGLATCGTYMRDLEHEISACRAALVGAAVTEIAIARAAHSGRLVG